MFSCSRRELARRFQQLADEGLLAVDDAARAALHFSQLVSTDEPALRRTKRDTTGIDTIVSAAVHAFLYGYITTRWWTRPTCRRCRRPRVQEA